MFPTDQPLLEDHLLRLLPQFTSEYTQVNGIRLHYVSGGQGKPLILLPGWPETWWAYHKLLPLLATYYRVIAVDLRGMGSSDKPAGGYDKKTMATDIAELIDQLGDGQAFVAGHDIGAHVAYSTATNYPNRVAKLVMLDTPHPDPSLYGLPMLPPHGMTTGQTGAYPWWVGFNQVKELPEQLLAGRMRLVIDWVFDHLLMNKNSLSEFDRAVYATAYDTPDGIRAGNAWYQAFAQDIEDSKTYGQLTMPVFGIGGSGYTLLQQALPQQATQLELAKLEEAGHFILAEQPQEVAELMHRFLG